MTRASSSRMPPRRRRTRGKALLAFTLLVIALSALAAPPPGAAYSCSVGEGRSASLRIEDCRGPVKTRKQRRPSAHETGKIGVTPLLLLVLSLGGTLLVPIGFDRVTRSGDDLHADRLLR